MQGQPAARHGRPFGNGTHDRRRIWSPDARAREGLSVSEEELERYESEIELALVQEYRAVLPMFSYVVETERRFYLANNVEVSIRDGSSPACVEVALTDAWVWDMY